MYSIKGNTSPEFIILRPRNWTDFNGLELLIVVGIHRRDSHVFLCVQVYVSKFMTVWPGK